MITEANRPALNLLALLSVPFLICAILMFAEPGLQPVLVSASFKMAALLWATGGALAFTAAYLDGHRKRALEDDARMTDDHSRMTGIGMLSASVAIFLVFYVLLYLLNLAPAPPL
jgi:hypothetical protein